MLFLSFRHPIPALLSLAEIGVSLIWMSGLMGLTGQPVFVTTLVLPVVLIASACPMTSTRSGITSTRRRAPRLDR